MRKELYISAVLTAVATILIIVGFYVPPTGEISGSVLTAVGEIFGFCSLWNVTVAVCRGKSVNLKHGQTEIEVKKTKDDEE